MFPNTEALQPLSPSLLSPTSFLHCSAHVFLTGVLGPPIINMSSTLQVFLHSDSYLTPEQRLLKIFQSLVSASSSLSSTLPITNYVCKSNPTHRQHPKMEYLMCRIAPCKLTCQIYLGTLKKLNINLILCEIIRFYLLRHRVLQG